MDARDVLIGIKDSGGAHDMLIELASEAESS